MVLVKTQPDVTEMAKMGQSVLDTIASERNSVQKATWKRLFYLMDGQEEMTEFELEISLSGMVRIECCSDWTADSLLSKNTTESVNHWTMCSRFRVDKGERKAACTGSGRDVFDKAAREGSGLPDIARGYLMLRSARLGPERQVSYVAGCRPVKRTSLKLSDPFSHTVWLRHRNVCIWLMSKMTGKKEKSHVAMSTCRG